MTPPPFPSSSPIDEAWYYLDTNNQVTGPISLVQLHQLFDSGVIGTGTYVVAAGKDEWSLYSVLFQQTSLTISESFPPPLPRSPQRRSPSAVFWVAIALTLFVCPPVGSLLALLSKRLTNVQKYVTFGIACVWFLSVALVLIFVPPPNGTSVESSAFNIEPQKSEAVQRSEKNPSVPTLSPEEIVAAAQEADALQGQLENLLRKLDAAVSSAGNETYIRDVRSCNIEANKLFDSVKKFTQRPRNSNTPFTDIGGSIGHPLITGSTCVKTAAQAAASQKDELFRQQTMEAREYLRQVHANIKALHLPAFSKSPTTNEPRFGIPKGCVGFKDKESVVELIRLTEVEEKTGDDTQLKELRIRQEKEEKRFDVGKDLVVRLVEGSPELKGYCEVSAENAQNLPEQRFWVHKSVLQGEETYRGSEIITGYMIFRGQTNAVFVDDMPVRELLDLVAGIYEGKISEKTAAKCVFMPNVQSGDAQNVVGTYIIYSALYSSSRPLIFAVPKMKDKMDSLRSAPLRFVGREDFTNDRGLVFSVPVMAPVEGLE